MTPAQQAQVDIAKQTNAWLQKTLHANQVMLAESREEARALRETVTRLQAKLKARP